MLVSLVYVADRLPEDDVGAALVSGATLSLACDISLATFSLACCARLALAEELLCFCGLLVGCEEKTRKDAVKQGPPGPPRPPKETRPQFTHRLVLHGKGRVGVVVVTVVATGG